MLCIKSISYSHWEEWLTHEPHYDKTNKVSVRPAKTQITLGIHPVWSESPLSTWKNLGSLATIERKAKALIRLGGCPGWSESSLGAHSFCWFCHVVAHINFEGRLMQKPWQKRWLIFRQKLIKRYEIKSQYSYVNIRKVMSCLPYTVL